MPESLYFFDYKGHSYLILTRYPVPFTKNLEGFEYIIHELNPKFPSEHEDTNKYNMVCAWDSSSFGVCLPKKHKNILSEMYDVFQHRDIAIWVGGGGVFQNGGLMLAIVSNVDEKHKKEMLEVDLNYKGLIKAAKDTGIEEKLIKAGKRWYALNPKWKSEFEGGKSPNGSKSKYNVVFWLNPMQQDINDSGWFTVEELELWVDSKGPILKKKGKEQ
jgi:hypothetical protein